jgi:hypothetical protein
MTLQKRQGLLVELLYLFIYGRMGAAFENDQFSPLNVALHPIGKACGGEQVVPAKRDLGRGFDLAELRFESCAYLKSPSVHECSRGR